jgi:hypothetical protein
MSYFKKSSHVGAILSVLGVPEPSEDDDDPHPAKTSKRLRATAMRFIFPPE